MFKNGINILLLLFIDFCIFIITIFFTFIIRNYNFSYLSISYSDLISQIYIFYPILLILIISLFISGMYEISVMYSRIKIVYHIIYSHIATAIFSSLIFYLFPNYFIGSPKTLLIIFIILNILLLSIWRIFFNSYLKNKKKIKAILIARNMESKELINHVNNNDLYPFYFIDYSHILNSENFIFNLNIILKESNIYYIVLDIYDKNIIEFLPHIYNLSLSDKKIKIYNISQIYQDIFHKTQLSSIGYFWFFEHVTLDKKIYDFFKRIIDIILSIPLLIAFLIVLPFVYIALKLENEGDKKLFSIQKRFGQGLSVIKVLKFRTMLYTDGGKWREDPDNQNRPTKVGQFLRKTNIDEFPQVINILKGEMSFIGPRNDILELGEKLLKEIPHYIIRYSIKPGISGWAQILQKEIPHTLDQTINRLQYDLYYVKNRSILIDLIIILKTIKTLLSRIFK